MSFKPSVFLQPATGVLSAAEDGGRFVLIDHVLDNSTVGILIVDAEGKIAWLNKRFAGYFGLDKADALGRHHRRVLVELISPAVENPQEFIAKILAAYRNQTEAEQFECYLPAKGDRYACWLEHRSHPIPDGHYAGGRIEHYTDITARKQTEQNHQKLAEQVQHAQKMESIGILAGGIAHDFNNILQAISGYTQLLMMEKQFNDPDFDMLSEIETAARKACALTQQLLAFSRRVESALNPAELNETVESVRNILARTIPKMIRIELDLAERLKPVSVDEDQVEQALMNLGVNAQQAMPDGGTLTFKTENVLLDQAVCETAFDLSPGEYVRIQVTDTGCGMDTETVAHVFDPFFTTRGVGQGSGLGLSMTYGIVKNHGGHIDCTSAPGEGTTFSIYLPVTIAAEKALPPETDADARLVGNGETILIVDDDEAVLHLGKNILERFGYRTLSALTGESAIELYETNGGQIDLVLLDLNMPGMGGRKCLTELMHRAPGLKIIVASGYPPVGEIQELLESVNGQFLGKPYQLNDMVQKVSEVLHAG
jgi:PAS domain S-box-containing protein